MKKSKPSITPQFRAKYWKKLQEKYRTTVVTVNIIEIRSKKNRRYHPLIRGTGKDVYRKIMDSNLRPSINSKLYYKILIIGRAGHSKLSPRKAQNFLARYLGMAN